jgi:acyl-CoA synthetase (AMP-forming)/AMP-acid ligase II
VRWLEAISTWKATTSGGPTHAFELCVRCIRDDNQLAGVDLSSWQVAYCGSEKVRADSLDRFGERFAPQGFRRSSLLPCFGLAEATLIVTGAGGAGVTSAAPAEASHLPAVGCGPAVRGSSVIVIDPQTNTRLADGLVGEVWVRGPHVALGYWRAGDAADDPFRAHLADGSGPYLRTGDLGFLRAGELFVTGRIKDTIIVNGANHGAEDIEASAQRSHALFAGQVAAAFAVDSAGQERPALILEIGRDRRAPQDVAEAIAAAFAGVTREHGLRLFDLVLVKAGSIPRTSSGKVRRARAREVYLAGGFERLNPPGAPFREASMVLDPHDA